MNRFIYFCCFIFISFFTHSISACDMEEINIDFEYCEDQIEERIYI